MISCMKSCCWNQFYRWPFVLKHSVHSIHAGRTDTSRYITMLQVGERHSVETQVSSDWGIMVSTQMLLLQLLLFSLASASHNYGGSSSFTFKGRNPDGTFRVSVCNMGSLLGDRYLSRGTCFSFTFNIVIIVLCQFDYSDYPEFWIFNIEIHLSCFLFYLLNICNCGFISFHFPWESFYRQYVVSTVYQPSA